jgi:hypothetical protein
MGLLNFPLPSKLDFGFYGYQRHGFWDKGIMQEVTAAVPPIGILDILLSQVRVRLRSIAVIAYLGRGPAYSIC